jgi:hypothetical protein
MSRKDIGVLVGGAFFLLSIGLFAHPFIAGFSYDPALVWISALCSLLLAPVLNWAIGGRAASGAVPRWTQPGPATLAAKTWSRVVRGLAFALIFSSGALLMAIIVIKERPEGAQAGFFSDLKTLLGYAAVLLFVLVAGLFALHGTTHLLERLKFAKMPLRLVRHPLSPGEQLTATLQLGGRGAGLSAVNARLACVEVVYRREAPGPGMNRATMTVDERDSWSSEAVFPVSESPSGRLVRIDIGIPADLPVTSAPEGPHGVQLGREYYRWELTLRAELKGVDLDRTYPILVQAPPEQFRSA